MTHGSDERETKPGGLEAPVKEHLGRELRAAYGTVEPRPGFLGDPALPPECDDPVRRLHQSHKAHETGVAAVEQALSDLIDPEERPQGPGALAVP